MVVCRESMANPSWIKALFAAFRIKEPLVHSSTCTRTKKFYPAFCIDCLKLVCKTCPGKEPNDQHKEHQLLMAFQASGQDGLDMNDLRKLIDITDIQLYHINARLIVYINKRVKDSRSSNNKNCKDVAHKYCEICGWELLNKANKFCSLECKAASGRSLSLKSESANQVHVDQVQVHVDQVHVDQVQVQSCRKRKRKGIPTRARPFYGVNILS